MGGSCVNVGSERLVRKLALHTLVHQRLYRLQWLSEVETADPTSVDANITDPIQDPTRAESDSTFYCFRLWLSEAIEGRDDSATPIISEHGQLVVNRYVEVAFTLGRYEDKVLCDVVLMEATQLLLGRPWQFDRKVNHDGVINRFIFVHIGKKKLKEKREKKSDKRKIVKKVEIKESTKSGKSNREEKRKESLLAGPSEIRKVLLAKKEPLYSMSANMSLHAYSSSLISFPTSMKNLLKEFKDMFPEDIPPRLTLKGYRTPFDLSLRVTLFNKSAYKMYPKEGKDI
ncbi:hypothetical protein CR513_02300, partial [Mucuna pruriens]